MHGRNVTVFNCGVLASSELLSRANVSSSFSLAAVFVGLDTFVVCDNS